MKIIALFVCTVLSLKLFSQTVTNNKFTDETVGISLQLDSTWQFQPPSHSVATAFKKAKGETITLHMLKMDIDLTDFYRDMTEDEIKMFHDRLKKKFEELGETVLSVKIEKGQFAGYPCVVGTFHLKKPSIQNGNPTIVKQFSFVTKKNYQVNLSYRIPESVATNEETETIEKQLSSFKEI